MTYNHVQSEKKNNQNNMRTNFRYRKNKKEIEMKKKNEEKKEQCFVYS